MQRPSGLYFRLRPLHFSLLLDKLAGNGDCQIHRGWMNDASHMKCPVRVPRACGKACACLNGCSCCAPEVRRARLRGRSALVTNHQNMFGTAVRLVRKGDRAALCDRDRGGTERIGPHRNRVRIGAARRRIGRAGSGRRRRTAAASRQSRDCQSKQG